MKQTMWAIVRVSPRGNETVLAGTMSWSRAGAWSELAHGKPPDTVPWIAIQRRAGWLRAQKVTVGWRSKR